MESMRQHYMTLPVRAIKWSGDGVVDWRRASSSTLTPVISSKCHCLALQPAQQPNDLMDINLLFASAVRQLAELDNELGVSGPPTPVCNLVVSHRSSRSFQTKSSLSSFVFQYNILLVRRHFYIRHGILTKSHSDSALIGLYNIYKFYVNNNNYK